jgi:hypothetical protein
MKVYIITRKGKTVQATDITGLAKLYLVALLALYVLFLCHT